MYGSVGRVEIIVMVCNWLFSLCVEMCSGFETAWLVMFFWVCQIIFVILHQFLINEHGYIEI